MPEYDPVNYPKPATGDLTKAEVGRDMVIPGSSTGTTGEQPTAWPSAQWTVPDQYAGPVPAREYEVSGLGRTLTSRPPVNSPATTDDGKVEPSIVPPPGHE